VRRHGSGRNGWCRAGFPLLALLVAALTGPACAQEATTPEAAVAKVCTGCHALQLVMNTPRDYDSWHETVQKMIDRGARGSQEEFGLVMDFLFQNMTTVDVNHATLEDLMTVLHAPQASGEAILARRARQPFKDMADLQASVPGLDPAILTAKKRMIFFQ
jgi:competence protein ComEA